MIWLANKTEDSEMPTAKARIEALVRVPSPVIRGSRMAREKQNRERCRINPRAKPAMTMTARLTRILSSDPYQEAAQKRIAATTATPTQGYSRITPDGTAACFGATVPQVTVSKTHISILRPR